jgi:RNA polymerase sigma-70 factor, ECF subfamily
VTAADPLAETLRCEGGRILAVLARNLGDIERAEDALQDASVAAVEVWSRTGPPRDPAAWLYVAARRKALDTLRREGRRPGRERDADALARLLAPDLPPAASVEDDQLRLVFTCCHPSLDLDTRVALALRTLCRLTTADVARVLLSTEAAMARRLSRARRKIAVAGIPFRIPEADELPGRLGGVAAVIHLVYTAGHSAAGDQLVRADLCDDAVRLARLVVHLLPDQPTATGLLALLLLTDARRPARLDAAGDVVPLSDQDRRSWDRAAIDEGLALLDRSLQASDGLADAYQLQAAIAACHATAPSLDATDWREVLRLYDLLAGLGPNPVVTVNAAVARAEVEGPAAALASLEAVPSERRSHTWHAATGEMLHRLGRGREAATAFATAAALAPADAERRHLTRRSEQARR